MTMTLASCLLALLLGSLTSASEAAGVGIERRVNDPLATNTLKGLSFLLNIVKKSLLRDKRDSLGTCNPPCKLGQCCLQKTPTAKAICENSQLAGKPCGWEHYTDRNPNTTVAIQSSMCPCMLGMICTAGKLENEFACTFMK